MKVSRILSTISASRMLPAEHRSAGNIFCMAPMRSYHLLAKCDLRDAGTYMHLHRSYAWAVGDPTTRSTMMGWT